MQTDYDPTKPFNKDTLKKIQETWKNSDILHNKNYGCDGIGTKGYLHWGERTFRYGAQDAWAMNINDRVRDRAFPPYVVVDHLMIQEEDNEAIATIIDELAKLALHHNAVIAAGETAILDTLQGFEIGIVMQGDTRQEDVDNPKQVAAGDAVIGLSSSGVHSNGYTKVRQIMKEQGLSLKNNFPWGKRVGEELTIPTYIYADAILECLNNFPEDVHGMVNITGGAFTKPKGILNEKYDLNIHNNHQLKPQEIFYYLKEKGNMTDEDMLKRFNCGIGYILMVNPDRKDEILSDLNKHYTSEIIGSIEEGSGNVHMISPFSEKLIHL